MDVSSNITDVISEKVIFMLPQDRNRLKNHFHKKCAYFNSKKK